MGEKMGSSAAARRRMNCPSRPLARVLRCGGNRCRMPCVPSPYLPTIGRTPGKFYARRSEIPPLFWFCATATTCSTPAPRTLAQRGSCTSSTPPICMSQPAAGRHTPPQRLGGPVCRALPWPSSTIKNFLLRGRQMHHARPQRHGRLKRVQGGGADPPARTSTFRRLRAAPAGDCWPRPRDLIRRFDSIPGFNGSLCSTRRCSPKPRAACRCGEACPVVGSPATTRRVAGPSCSVEGDEVHPFETWISHVANSALLPLRARSPTTASRYPLPADNKGNATVLQLPGRPHDAR